MWHAVCFSVKDVRYAWVEETRVSCHGRVIGIGDVALLFEERFLSGRVEGPERGNCHAAPPG